MATRQGCVYDGEVTVTADTRRRGDRDRRSVLVQLRRGPGCAHGERLEGPRLTGWLAGPRHALSASVRLSRLIIDLPAYAVA